MKKNGYYRNLEELPPAPVCNVILNGKIIFEEFFMSAILEMLLSKNLELKDEKLYFINSDNITEYQFDFINLLFNRYEINKTANKEILFLRKMENKYMVDTEYKELYDALEQEAKKQNTKPYYIYKEIINKLNLNGNIIVHKDGLGRFFFSYKIRWV